MKRIEKKPILIAIALILIQSFGYLVCKFLEGAPHLIGNAIDDKIPFSVYAIIPYSTWFFLLIIVPYILYKKDKNSLSKYIVSYILMVIIADITYIIYPTTLIRPEVTGTNIIELIARLVFWVDTPVLNCFPSMHCAVSMLWLLYVLVSKETSRTEKIIIPILCIIIMISTLFIKQHVFIDLISGVIISTMVFIVVQFEKKLTLKVRKALKF